MDNEEQVDETINSSEEEVYEVEAEDTTEDSETNPELEALKSELEQFKGDLLKEREARKQLTARAKKAEEALKKAKPDLQDNVEDKSVLNDEAVDLRLDGYSREEVDFILANGGRDALAKPDSYVSIALRAKREQIKAEEAAAKAKDTSQSTGTTKKYTRDQLEKLSSEELEKILPHQTE